MRTGENFTARSRGYSPSRFAGRVWRQAQAKSAYHDDNIVRVDSSNCLDMPPAVNPTDSLLRGTHQDGLHSQDAWGGVEHQSRNRWGSSSGYGVSPGAQVLAGYLDREHM